MTLSIEYSDGSKISKPEEIMKTPHTLPGALGWADLERQKRRARIADGIVCTLAIVCLFIPMFIDLFGA